ncbi:hypothetical protein CEXT_269621 [Caerostris extrusa]|uniref:Uncharacterized protein n=1 Tax=Caerostris extrusa TaxID=172846 RepID=A0AAV4XP61_CAEEX|nr:hypothetical protein CEXT_269621 [Caerostris extrusa]
MFEEFPQLERQFLTSFMRALQTLLAEDANKNLFANHLSTPCLKYYPRRNSFLAPLEAFLKMAEDAIWYEIDPNYCFCPLMAEAMLMNRIIKPYSTDK